MAAATFIGDAEFTGASVDFPANFEGVVFERNSTFANAQIDGADFKGAAFKGNCTFNSSHIRENATFSAGNDLPPAKFLHEADFTAIKVDGAAEFQGVLFNGETRFNFAMTGLEANFQGTRFKGNATFNAAEFRKVALFDNSPELGIPGARFQKEANFTAAHFENAQFGRAEFAGSLKFEHAEVEGRTVFVGARFLSGPAPDFRGSFFHQEAWFQGVEFPRGADFRGCQFSGEAGFEGTRFLEVAHFEGSRFAGLALFNSGPDPLGSGRFPGATFGSAQLDHARFESDARFDDTLFTGPVTLREALFQAVFFSPDGRVSRPDGALAENSGGLGDQFRGTVDLRGCTYQHIQVKWDCLLRCPDRTPRLQPYDRQPYIQLEEVLRRAGNDDEADGVYLERRKVERQRKLGFSWCLDKANAMFLNYGVHPYSLLVYVAILLAIGTWVFSRPAAVSPRGEGTSSLGSTVAPSRCAVGFGVAVHYFLPIEVALGSGWLPSEEAVILLRRRLPWFTPTVYATILKIAGWVLVPVGIVILTGLIRRISS